MLGVVEELYSTNLAERRKLNIYLPEGYQPGDTTRYPVIYLLDGSADEDFIHVVGLVQFNTFPWVHAMPKSIVVGIATVNRQRDFTYPTSQAADQKLAPSGGQSGKFIAFLAQELQPYVQRRYRTTAAKTLIGQSLGGLLATEILFNHPALFTQYVIISPSLWWDDGSLLRQTPVWAQASLPYPLAVYLAVGKEGLGPGAGAHVMEVEASRLYAKLASAPGQRVRSYFDYLPQEDHATISHQAIQNALRWLYARPPAQP